MMYDDVGMAQQTMKMLTCSKACNVVVDMVVSICALYGWQTLLFLIVGPLSVIARQARSKGLALDQ